MEKFLDNLLGSPAYNHLVSKKHSQKQQRGK